MRHDIYEEWDSILWLHTVQEEKREWFKLCGGVIYNSRRKRGTRAGKVSVLHDLFGEV